MRRENYIQNILLLYEQRREYNTQSWSLLIDNFTLFWFMVWQPIIKSNLLFCCSFTVDDRTLYIEVCRLGHSSMECTKYFSGFSYSSENTWSFGLATAQWEIWRLTEWPLIGTTSYYIVAKYQNDIPLQFTFTLSTWKMGLMFAFGQVPYCGEAQVAKLISNKKWEK